MDSLLRKDWGRRRGLAPPRTWPPASPGQSALPAPARRRVREGGHGLQNEKRKEFGYDFYKLLKHRQPK